MEGNFPSLVGVSILMNILLTPWDFRALWTCLPLLSKLYLLVLLVASSFSTAMLLKIIFRPVPSPHSRLENLQQLHLWLLFPFGVCFVDQVFSTFRAIGRSVASLSAATADIFDPAVAFAFTTCCILLALHSLQWFTAFRTRRGQ
jgi:hypothetical protein